MPKKVDMMQDIYLSIARGDAPTWSHVNKYGRNRDVDANATPLDIWGAVGNLVTLPVAQKINIVSNSALDTDAGTGARSVKIFGLDASWNELQEIVTLNGIVPVQTTNDFIRVYRTQSQTVGVLGHNAGIIVLTGAVALTAVGMIHATEGQSSNSHYTVPGNKTAFITGLWACMVQTTGSSTATIGLFLRIGADVATSPLNLKHTYHISTAGGISERNYRPYFKVSPKTDIIFRALTVSGNNTDICVGYDLILVEN